MSRRKSGRKNQASSNKTPLKRCSASASPGRATRGGLPMDNAPPAIEALEQVNLNAAGIDVGASLHFVAVPEGRDPSSSVRSFGAFTADLEGICQWLTECKITTVAMESTGVYWIPLYELLESRGFEVLLVEPSQIKKYRRKTDVIDSQWIQTLHTFGLLRGSFRPDDAIIVLRSYTRQRAELVSQAARYTQHMQKAMEQMNLKLTEVISDILGVTGLAIIDAILAGERDPQELAKLRHERCHHDEYTIALALQGNWRQEHLFALKQAVELYRFCMSKIDELDREVEAYMRSFEAKADESELGKPTKRHKRYKRTNEPKFQVRELLYRMTGQDLTTIDSIGEHAALQIISEIGTDMSRWPTEKHFVSWLCLCPELKKSGGKPQKKRKSKTQSSTNRVATVLRVCAQSLLNSKCSLGAFGRRLRARDGAPVAITAMARKLAVTIYKMLRYGQPYIDQGADHYDSQQRAKALKSLQRRAARLGFQLNPVQDAA